MKAILFSIEMVRAILEGRKTVTRRVIKPVALGMTYEDGSPARKSLYTPGDILYVRETWNYGYCDTTDFEFRYNETFFEELKPGSYKDSYLMPRYFYRTDDLDGIVGIKWRPSIFMPRDAARIFLRVTDVRVERLQDITHSGIEKEGIVTKEHPGSPDRVNPFFTFKSLWDSTIKHKDAALYGWDANPYVWVIEFEKISKEEALKRG